MTSDPSQSPVTTSPSGATPPQPHPAPALPSSSNISTSANTSPKAQVLDLRHIAPMAPAMKERTVSSSTDRSGRAMHQLMSVSPPHRLGSRSPVSIPSSPTSVHSSSSAIFERDVEPSPSHPLSPHPHTSNPHRTPRSKITEALDQSVPTVLDSAAALLASTDGEFDESMIAIEAPVPISEASRAGSSIGSPIGRGSRSPSPTTSSSRNRTSMLLNLPSPIQSSIVPLSVSPRTSPPLPGSPTRPPPPPLVTNFTAAPIPGPSAVGARNGTVETEAHPPRSATPTSVGGDTQYESATSSPTTTTMERPPHPLPTPTTSTFTAHQTSPLRNTQILPAPGLSHQFSSHPPSPSHAAHKRLSFVSYNDILASTPISTIPLSSFTSPGLAESPPHLPPVSLSVSAAGIAPGLGSRSVSAAASAAGSARNSLFISSDNSILNGICRGAADIKEPTGGVADEVGGEWEREGLGRGLEERLEALMAVGPGKA